MTPAERHPEALTPRRLAEQLGHDDRGVRVRRFLHDAPDGGAPVAHQQHEHWLLSDADADRVRRWFANPPISLSEQELAVAHLYATGSSASDVARSMDIGIESVRTYLRRIRQKIRNAGHAVDTRADLLIALPGADAARAQQPASDTADGNLAGATGQGSTHAPIDIAAAAKAHRTRVDMLNQRSQSAAPHRHETSGSDGS